MKDLNFTKVEILKALKTNRTKHELIYQEALKNYKDKVLQELNLTLEKVRNNEKFILWFNLKEPIQHLKEYDRTISMLENCLDETISLNDQEYTQFVQDDWDWQQEFLTSNSVYSNMAMTRLTE